MLVQKPQRLFLNLCNAIYHLIYCNRTNKNKTSQDASQRSNSDKQNENKPDSMILYRCFIKFSVFNAFIHRDYRN